jgi:hypothetical protein
MHEPTAEQPATDKRTHDVCFTTSAQRPLMQHS